ncbi:MAG: hypothetical protein L0H36_00790 [bacterium]|nr:hypothetical protein [bacterium]MDN5835153.1 hypothetical protein [bacterium]
MGLFQNKPNLPVDESSDGIQRFFDGYFQELRSRGRKYFENVIEQKVNSFKKDLDASTEKSEQKLKDYVVEKVDQQIGENYLAIGEVQARTMESMQAGAKDLEQRYQSLSHSLENAIAKQSNMLEATTSEHQAQLATLKQAQDKALETLTSSVDALGQQQQRLAETLEQNASKQQQLLIDAFQDNMARVIEHYLRQALGDQYDIKKQLPTIIQHMEANKQAIQDDISL